MTQLFDELFRLFSQAANQGHVTAQCNLGSCYEKGEGVEKNLSKAIEWYKTAAEQENERAK